jgi:hypothetical protein
MPPITVECQRGPRGEFRAGAGRRTGTALAAAALLALTGSVASVGCTPRVTVEVDTTAVPTLTWRVHNHTTGESFTPADNAVIGIGRDDHVTVTVTAESPAGLKQLLLGGERSVHCFTRTIDGRVNHTETTRLPPAYDAEATEGETPPPTAPVRRSASTYVEAGVNCSNVSHEKFGETIRLTAQADTYGKAKGNSTITLSYRRAGL